MKVTFEEGAEESAVMANVLKAAKKVESDFEICESETAQYACTHHYRSDNDCALQFLDVTGWLQLSLYLVV